MEKPGELAWDLRVAAVGQDAARVFVREHQFEVGAPLSFDREEKRVTALETALGAVGADVVVGLQRLARQRRLLLENVEATVQARLRNPLVYLGVVGEEGDPGVGSIRVRVYITTTAPPDAVERLWQEALERSPLVCTLRNTVSLDLTYKLVP